MATCKMTKQCRLLRLVSWKIRKTIFSTMKTLVHFIFVSSLVLLNNFFLLLVTVIKVLVLFYVEILLLVIQENHLLTFLQYRFFICLLHEFNFLIQIYVYSYLYLAMRLKLEVTRICIVTIHIRGFARNVREATLGLSREYGISDGNIRWTAPSQAYEM